MRVCHAEWLENPLGREFAERLTAHAVHDHSHQRESAVRVQLTITWDEVQVLLSREQLQHVVIGDQVAGITPAREAQQVPLVADSARVVRQVPDGDLLSEVRQLRHVLPDVVVQRQLAVLSEQQDRRAGELLRDRSHVKDGGRGQPDVMIQIGHAVRPAKGNGVPFVHRDSASRRAGFRVVGEDGVYLCGARRVSDALFGHPRGRYSQ
jgi:hypothetical protein